MINIGATKQPDSAGRRTPPPGHSPDFAPIWEKQRKHYLEKIQGANFDNVMAIPGVPEVLKPTVDTLKTQLAVLDSGN